MKNLITQHSESKTEEMISALWFIVALLWYQNNFRWVALVFLIPAALSILTAFRIAVHEIIEERRAAKEPKDDTTFAA